MSPKRPKVIVTRRLPDAVELRLKELFDAELNATDQQMSEDELAAAVERADILVSTVTDQINGRVLARAGEQLQMI
ncbi:MAG: D-glycerate dehydrogenase, partial [Henriciella sp.]